MKRTGRVSHWDDKKGFGFIRDKKSSEDVFFHISVVTNEFARPKTGNRVIYTSETDTKGKQKATSVDLKKFTFYKRHSFQAFVFALFYLALIFILVLNKKLPELVLALYIVVSTVTFFYYYYDKRAATKESSRVPEFTLHTLTFLFGWPGANFAQQLFRHKTKKKKFRIFYYLAVVANIGLVACLFLPQAQSLVTILNKISTGII